ncbi:protein of unknown function [Bradyrhizobium vignae]|uniref:Uncharacterized protein n=1 Tax=Bradyrhizobium vignae TaxID=1549949 RepID=A0A2U3Q9T5_9BRAD|nr:protein of unknown function [Bradyrhizobium vignae]
MSVSDRRGMLDGEGAVDPPLMRTAWLARSGVYRLQKLANERSGGDAADRRVVHRLAISRLAADHGKRRNPGLFAHWAAGSTVGWREPDESRGSRPVLRERGAAMPRTTHLR